MERFFVEPIVYVKRSSLWLTMNPPLTEDGVTVCSRMMLGLDEPSFAARVFVEEILKIALAVGFLDCAGEVPSDGSTIAFNRSLKKRESFPISALWAVRRSEGVDLDHFIDLVNGFLLEHHCLFEEISDEELRYGVLRYENLFSMLRVEEIGFADFLKMIAANMVLRKRIFAHRFAAGFNGSCVPVDDEPARNIFTTAGHLAEKMGKVMMGGGEVDVFLKISFGFAENSLGIDYGITVADPHSSYFTVATKLVANNGAMIPTICKVQASPLQIDRNFDYQKTFVPHEQSPSFAQSGELKKAIEEDLLGGGEIFRSMVMMVSYFYRSLGYRGIDYIGPEENLWLRYHNPRMSNHALERIQQAFYAEIPRNLGFSNPTQSLDLDKDIHSSFSRGLRLPAEKMLTSEGCVCLLDALSRAFPLFDWRSDTELIDVLGQAEEISKEMN